MVWETGDQTRHAINFWMKDGDSIKPACIRAGRLLNLFPGNFFSLQQTTDMFKQLSSFKYAWNGIVYFLRYGNNARIQSAAAVLATGMGYALGLSRGEWISVILCCALVLSLEMINTAIEKTCDLITTEYNPLVKIIKDVAAGAVLLSAVASLVIGIIIFFPKILLLF